VRATRPTATRKRPTAQGYGILDADSMDAPATPSSEGSRKVLRESVAQTARRARIAVGAIIAMAAFLRVGGSSSCARSSLSK